MSISLKRTKFASPISPTIYALLGAIVGCTILSSQPRLIELLNQGSLLGNLALHPLRRNNLFEVIGCLAALIFALYLPLLIRRLIATVSEAARAGKSEMRLNAAAVLMYDCIRNRSGEISDFKFTFLNRSAERMIGVDREHVLGKNLLEVFPALCEPGRLAIYREVVETGEPAVLELTHPLLKNDNSPPRHPVQVVKLQDGIAMTVTDVTLRAQYKEDLTRALSFNKSVVTCSPFSIIVTDTAG